MRKLITRSFPMAVALAVGFATAPGTVDAQEKAQEQEKERAYDECTVEVAPGTIQAGQEAVALQATLSHDIGTVTEVKASGESGIVLATPEQIQKVEMAREGEETPEPIEIARTGEDVTATVWLNTAEASEGTFELVLKSDAGQKCKAQVTVERPGGEL